MNVCDEYFNCSFIRKHEASTAPVCKGLIRKYCRSGLNEDCARKQMEEPISPDILPTGDQHPCDKQRRPGNGTKLGFLKKIFGLMTIL